MRLVGMSPAHPLGTDQYGRDTLSRVMVGAVNSIIVGLVTVAIGLSIGVLLGLAAAYYGKMVDESIMRFSDFLFGFPAVLTAILITSIQDVLLEQIQGEHAPGEPIWIIDLSHKFTLREKIRPLNITHQTALIVAHERNCFT